MMYVGSLWPLEAMPTWLRYISYTFPLTAAAQASKAIMGRGIIVILTLCQTKQSWFFSFLPRLGVSTCCCGERISLQYCLVLHIHYYRWQFIHIFLIIEKFNVLLCWDHNNFVLRVNE